MTENRTVARHPLDEVMLAMDVVDTLRHRQLLVERELNSETRERKLIERLREIYAAQGIEVPDHVLAEGVTALAEDRFVYTPPEPGFGVRMARLYISRGTWGKALFALLGIVAAVWITYAVFIGAPQQRRLQAIPVALETQRQAIVELSDEPEASTRAGQFHAQGMTALQDGDIKEAEQAITALKAIRYQLEQEYTLRIVSRPDELSGFWRVPDINPDARNYYIIVEAVTPDGTTLTLPVLNEEDGRTYRVNKWGLRVGEQLFEQITADKQDDGIIQNNRFGEKQRGHLDPVYLMPTSGNTLTTW